MKFRDESDETMMTKNLFLNFNSLPAFLILLGMGMGLTNFANAQSQNADDDCILRGITVTTPYDNNGEGDTAHRRELALHVSDAQALGLAESDCRTTYTAEQCESFSVSYARNDSTSDNSVSSTVNLIDNACLNSRHEKVSSNGTSSEQERGEIVTRGHGDDVSPPRQ
jgi:hypothetical protein